MVVTEFPQVRNIAKIYRISGERTHVVRSGLASHGPRSPQSGATNSGFARNKREKAPFFPRERMPRTRVRVSPRVPVLPSPRLSFRGKKSRRGVVNQSPRDSGANERCGNRMVGRA